MLKIHSFTRLVLVSQTMNTISMSRLIGQESHLARVQRPLAMMRRLSHGGMQISRILVTMELKRLGRSPKLQFCQEICQDRLAQVVVVTAPTTQRVN